MGRQGRSLTVHCSGPEVLGATDGQPSGDEVRLWFARLDDLRARIPHFLELLDPVERDRADRFRFAQDRERFVIAHGALRTLLGGMLGTSPRDILFARGPHGKPHIQDQALRFNLSDTKDAVLIAFAQRHEVGADLETMARKVDHDAVAEHYFTREEVHWIRTAPAESKHRFLSLWTRKEAVLKASGVGIMEDLKVLRVDGTHNVMTITHDAFMQHAAAEYHVRTWTLGTDHILSVAGEVPLNSVRLIGLDDDAAAVPQRALSPSRPRSAGGS